MQILFNKILIPVDTESPELAQRAIHVGSSFGSSEVGHKIRLINVQSLVPLGYADYLPPDFDQNMRKNAENMFAEFISKLSYVPESLSKAIRYGSVYYEILAEAQEWGADLIIMGSHQPRLMSILLGSNAATVVQHAPCSVLIIRD